MYGEQLHRLQHKQFVLQYISVQGESCTNTGIMFSAHLRDWALNGLDIQRDTHVLKVEIKNCSTSGKTNYCKRKSALKKQTFRPPGI